MLNKREVTSRDYMINVFVPSLHQVFEQFAPDKVFEWKGNCSGQVAVFGAYTLSELLRDYKWSAWEGEIKEFSISKWFTYTHSWIIGEKEGRRLIIDLSRPNKEPLFYLTTTNTFPKEVVDYSTMEIISSKEIDWVGTIFNDSIKECYTGLNGREFLRQLNTYMLFNGIKYLAPNTIKDTI